MPKSCAELANVVSSPDALGLLADLFCAWRATALARPAASAKIDGHFAGREPENASRSMLRPLGFSGWQPQPLPGGRGHEVSVSSN